MFTKMNAKKGIKLFGERAIKDMFKECKQLDDGTMAGKPVVAPSNTDGINLLYKKKTLEDVNFIEDKRRGKIKGRTCTNYSKKIRYIKTD